MSSLPRLLVVTDRRATARGRPLVEVIRAALAGGARLVQLREKDLEGRDLLGLAEALGAECQPAGARLLVNERIDVALAAGADGVVLPADSFPPRVARRLLGPTKLLARSTHAASEIEQAAAEGADFVLFGPVYPTPSKSRFGPPQGLERLRTVSRLGIPVFAVGGITAENAEQTIGAGAHGIAVIREVIAAADPQAATRSLLRSISVV